MKLDEAPEIVATRGSGYNEPRMIIHHRHVPNGRAAFAMQMMERWAPVAGDTDGEDTAGRQKGRRMTAKEITAHCCDVAEEAFAEFERRGWFFAVPSWEEMRDAARKESERN